MTAAAQTQPVLASLAPSAVAVVSTVVGMFLPFIGLPIAMVSVVAVAVAGIQNRRLRYLTIALVTVAILVNLAFVMMALPAGRELVHGP